MKAYSTIAIPDTGRIKTKFSTAALACQASQQYHADQPAIKVAKARWGMSTDILRLGKLTDIL
jgi:hypothetical protein